MAGRVAVVDDDEFVCGLLTMLLEERGYEVATYRSVRAAREALARTVPDLLIVDVNLPDGCGLDLVSGLRGEAGRKIPAIVLSGAREERDIVRGFAAGAVDYLPKPFTKEELLARCGVHLARTTELERSSSLDIELPMRGGLAFGRYRVVREIGRGGNGRVYLAEDADQGGRHVALKVLAPVSGERDEAKLRFIRETYALASVRHPRIVPVHDVGTGQGQLYLSMEFVEGESLLAHVRRHGPVDEPRARELCRGLLGAVEALAQVGLVHRDLKPANVILRNGVLEDPVLIDFGLCKRAHDRGITAQDVVVGTPCFLPPEVIRGHEADVRSDLFQLGLTVRFALAGEEIFPDLSGVDLLTAIATTPVPDPDVELTPGFCRLLQRLWDRDPLRRPRSAGEALAVLAQLEGGAAAGAARGANERGVG